MNGLLLDCYRTITKTIYPIASLIADLKGNNQDKQLLNARLGRHIEHINTKAPYDIWLHAVSVGEVMVAEAIIKALLGINPSLNILLSSFTPTGLDLAHKRLNNHCTITASPFDLPQATEKLLEVSQPKLYACIETELWPNMFIAAQTQGAKTAIVNARLSPRSFKNYTKLKNALSPMLANLDRVMAISDADANRFIELGARRKAVIVTGNAKYESLLSRVEAARSDVEKLRLQLAFATEDKVFVAGSIRGGEEQATITAWKEASCEHPNLHLLLVPRHLERVSDVAKLMKHYKINFSLWSELRQKKTTSPPQVIVVDVIGLLFWLYAIADIAFVGGSLVPKGGQNLMEPAAWSKPVLFGASTENFLDASQMLLAQNGGIVVKNESELAFQLKKLLSNRLEAEKIGKNARKTLEMLSKNAATKQAVKLLKLLRQENRE